MDNKEPFISFEIIKQKNLNKKLRLARTRLRYANDILNKIIKEEKENEAFPDILDGNEIRRSTEELLPIYDILKGLIKSAEEDIAEVINTKIKVSE
ncbi:hypothetical protein [Yersinia pestis]|uniref:Uncharacterized protein n=1 Tax=Yersinia pestis subsp. pestis bv. Medievalis TaxID=1234662 RepID=A0A096ZX90_YERPE|nr:hypothetical protein [Yersinia pestis]AIS36185.1 hypothetical protein [Yersinia pestis subsp. pestis bv. Medievalis]KAA5809388.1 hypothetical protein F1600_20155 [Yersinia pestis]NSL64645.1 hypothetical protein [Yersinia pestis]PVF55877.1 hypothetical protein BCY80_21235 [Yersinia pestis]QFR87656.1 hypothetical protein DJY80_22705 [Yersinia pestis subsp. pestis bv. Medievalis]